jgi:urea transport system substrate-binding protein
VKTDGDTIKIGFLNSRSGTMAISENTVYDALEMAKEEINAAGGVNGNSWRLSPRTAPPSPPRSPRRRRS